MKTQIRELEAKYEKKKVPSFNVGDEVNVYLKILEDNKMRAQLFHGIVISKKGEGMGKSFTVRRISYGEGVERVFPLNSPLIEKIAVEKKGVVRRAKLYYLRGKKGTQATKVKEKIVQSKET